MKKIVLLFMILVFTMGLSACSSADKEFSDIGVTITLNDTFIEKDVIQAPLYLESQEYIFTGLRESYSSLVPYSIINLEDYIEAVLTNNGHGNTSYEAMTDDDDNVLYLYAYYHATVEDMDFGYMLIVMQGSEHFYTMNFGCLEDNLDDSKDQFMDWAETITVE
jgi:hypothetical protein